MSEPLNLTFTKSSPSFTIQPPSTHSLDLSINQVITAEPGGGSTYTWTQSISLAVWTIPHNLGRFPSVTVVDNLNNKIEPDIQYIDNNSLQIINGVALVGKAYLN